MKRIPTHIDRYRNLRAIIKSLKSATSVYGIRDRLIELNNILLQNEHNRFVAQNSNIIGCLSHLQNVNSYRLDNIEISYEINKSLALLGLTQPKNKKSVNVLSLDGGGTRGVISIQILKELQHRLDGRKIEDVFDIVCGVSTGAIIVALKFANGLNLDECESAYTEFGKKIFVRDRMRSLNNMLWTQAYYDSNNYEQILQEMFGEKTMLQTSKCHNSPRLALSSTKILGRSAEPFLFRNYAISPSSSVENWYDGTCNAKIWQAIRAATAAPIYFEGYSFNSNYFVDGGILYNNPCSLAIFECKKLWPTYPIGCVVSIGTGRPPLTRPKDKLNETLLSRTLGTVSGIIYSATNTENVHSILQDLLPSETYYRFNPIMSKDFQLDDIEELEKMKTEAIEYINLNKMKFDILFYSLERRSLWNLLNFSEDLVNTLHSTLFKFSLFMLDYHTPTTLRGFLTATKNTMNTYELVD
ncbi:hypothetical protein SNEBB_004244 [Seison nebaliae]|nr:hypothetical protein SNEBB_004244 [Seison nebaliae]